MIGHYRFQKPLLNREGLFSTRELLVILACIVSFCIGLALEKRFGATQTLLWAVVALLAFITIRTLIEKPVGE